MSLTSSEGCGLRGELGALFKAAMRSAYPAMNEDVMLVPCNSAKGGDYQCNNAMGLFGKLKGTEGAPKAPRDVGLALIAALPQNELIEETSLAGPGFINIKLSRPVLAARVQTMLTNGVASWAPKLPLKKAVVDFSSPNVAKEMHVGHLRSTIIGDTLCKTLEFCGVETLRLNHIGDWGTQFGMLIQHMAEGPGGLDGDEGVSDLMTLYRNSKKRFDEEPDFKTRAREAVTKLQSGDPTSLKAWTRICDCSRKEFQQLYDRLGVTTTERGESFYNPMLAGVVEELKEQGVAEVDNGAVCIFVEGHKVPLIIQKSDGGFGYASTDMAALKHRLTQEKADWIIYVTDVGQSQHFEMIFLAAKKAGWLKDGEGTKVSHVGFGLVLGEDGKRMKTRSGDVVRLVELLDEAKAKCLESIMARAAENGEELDEAAFQEAAGEMGYGAVKYADLRNHRMTDYKFSFDNMLSMQGNTAVYLLYAHARIAGISRKSGRDVGALASTAQIVLTHPKEVDLALQICKFPEAIEDLLSQLAPNRLTDFLYDLSEKFNAFYVDCKVLGVEEEDSRLLLVEAVAVVMRQCLSLLGIKPSYKL
ncbi:hypothetical protein FOA52_001899 [Chlamydomonas sp. UWO 241]|nr:hypothetical protein FOA52_001899 [Chlamydomonas sp. UWO 241]